MYRPCGRPAETVRAVFQKGKRNILCDELYEQFHLLAQEAVAAIKRTIAADIRMTDLTFPLLIRFSPRRADLALIRGLFMAVS